METIQDPEAGLEKSSTGLDANVAGLLSYLLAFLTGVVFLVLERRSSFVRFHAMQSTITFVSLSVVKVASGFLPLIGDALSFLIGPVSVILWILLMVKAFQGERFKLPIVGDMAEERAQIPEP